MLLIRYSDAILKSVKLNFCGNSVLLYSSRIVSDVFSSCTRKRPIFSLRVSANLLQRGEWFVTSLSAFKEIASKLH